MHGQQQQQQQQQRLLVKQLPWCVPEVHVIMCIPAGWKLWHEMGYLQSPASSASPAAVICQHSCRLRRSSAVSFPKAAMPVSPKLQQTEAASAVCADGCGPPDYAHELTGAAHVSSSLDLLTGSSP